MSENEKRAWRSPVRPDGMVNINYGDTLLATGIYPGEAERVAELINGEDKPEWLEHLSVLRLEPGDTIVLRTNEHPDPDSARYVVGLIEKVFPGHGCILLTDGMELGVVRGERLAAG